MYVNIGRSPALASFEMLHDICMARGWVQLEQERWLVCHSLGKTCRFRGWVYKLREWEAPATINRDDVNEGEEWEVQGSAWCLCELLPLQGRNFISVLHLEAWTGAFLSSLPGFLFRVGHIALPLLVEQHPALLTLLIHSHACGAGNSGAVTPAMGFVAAQNTTEYLLAAIHLCRRPYIFAWWKHVFQGLAAVKFEAQQGALRGGQASGCLGRQSEHSAHGNRPLRAGSCVPCQDLVPNTQQLSLPRLREKPCPQHNLHLSPGSKGWRVFYTPMRPPILMV